jgi:hypothetical protein
VFVHFGVVVEGESEKGVGCVRCEGCGVAWYISRYRKKKKKKTLFLISFLEVVGIVLLWHQSTSWVLHRSSIWLGSVSVAILLKVERGRTYFECIWGFLQACVLFSNEGL